MNENIATIQEFLTRSELRLARGLDIYQIILLFDDGRAQVYRNPHVERHFTQITLTEKEIAELASICFPPKKAGE